VTLLVLGHDIAPTRELVAELGANFCEIAPIARADDDWSFAPVIDESARRVAEQHIVDGAVICTWAMKYDAQPVVSMPLAHWLADVEANLALWYAIVTTAGARCRDGGALAVVVERPAPIDSTNYGAASAIAEGLIALSRSAALAHGGRGVRVNAVATTVFSAPSELLGSKPALAAYPGSVGVEVAGAVRAALGRDACGITATLVRADCGRSW
jgi:NAD(P)-dependent dehydrogenase (short-subunit alcohol dehydrogenase family)